MRLLSVDSDYLSGLFYDHANSRTGKKPELYYSNVQAEKGEGFTEES